MEYSTVIFQRLHQVHKRPVIHQIHKKKVKHILKKFFHQLGLYTGTPFLLTVPLAVPVTVLALWCQPNDFSEVIDIFTQKPLLIFLNVFPVWLLLCFTANVCGNVFWGAALENAVVCLLSLASRIKIQVRDEPLFPRDLFLLREAGNAVGDYGIVLPLWEISVVIAVTVLFLLAGVLLDACPEGLRKLPGRICSAAVSFGALTLAIVTVLSSDTIYNDLGATNPYRLSVVFNENGFPYNFCHQFTKYLVDRPSGYSRAQAVQWDTLPTAYDPAQAKAVNIVIVMNEAFSDITDNNVFAFDENNDPLKNLHAIQAEEHSISLRLVVPGFAGGTANTEFDVLTGMQTNSLGTGTTSALRTVNRNLNSLFRIFGTEGYHTSFFHPGEDWFYNRENVYHWFGTENTVFIDQMEQSPDFPMPVYKGHWVSDAYLTDLITQEFDRTVNAGNLLFHYTTTIQNHMAYPLSKYGDDYVYPSVPLNVSVPEDVQSILNVYAEGVRDADTMLGELRNTFAARSEPVILIFYGDHLPYLGDNQYVYTALGMDIAAPDELRRDYFCIYETPCVIWANNAAADMLDWETAVQNLDLPGHGKLSAAFLGAALLELTGRGNIDAWTEFLNHLRREVSVVQRSMWLTPDGTVINAADYEKSPGIQSGNIDITALSGEMQKWRQWSYYKLRQKEIPRTER